MLRVAGISVLMAAMLSGVAAKADEASCNAYADSAIAMRGEAINMGCPVDGPRWDPNRQAHFNACMDWSNDKRNGGMNAMNETLFRSMDLLNCEASKKNVTAPFQDSGFKGDDAPTLDSFCSGYAYLAIRQQSPVFFNKCGYTGPRWDTVQDHHRAACVGWGNQAGQLSAVESIGRNHDLIACELKLAAVTNPPPPSDAGGGQAVPVTQSQAVQVTQGVDVYDAAGGNGKQLGTLAAGTPGVVLLSPCQDSWCNVKWPDGEGWVYNGPDYRSLNVQ